MQKLALKLFVIAAAMTLTAPAQALTFQLDIDVTFAAGGNPLGATVGVFPNSGTADSGGNTITGSGEEFLSFSTAGDATADLTVSIGNILFTDEDEIEVSSGDVPEGIFQDGVFQGLDFVVLFTISGTDAIGIELDQTDLGQDTSAFLDGNHYWADFFDDGSFGVGVVTGFAEVFDPEDMETFLEPVIGGGFFVEGNVSAVPEPSLALLAGSGLLGVAFFRRR